MCCSSHPCASSSSSKPQQVRGPWHRSQTLHGGASASIGGVVLLAYQTWPVNAQARCEDAPPRIWKHRGCERWDCGDFSPVPEDCRWMSTGYTCDPPLWNCSSATAADAHGSFACLSGRWADILPHCLGDTSPGASGGTWKTLSRRVRAVLWKMNISWDRLPTSYRPDLCSATALGTVGQCQRVGFGVLLEQHMWSLIGHPLEDALCETGEFGDSMCSGAVSRRGDRLRIAGISGGPYTADAQSQADTYDGGWLLLHVEAVPVKAKDAERLRADIEAMASKFAGLSIHSEDIWGDFEYLEKNPLPSLDEWLRQGFSHLRASSDDFFIRKDTGFQTIQWLPTLHIDISAPYVMNRHDVPDWELVHMPDSKNQLLDTVMIIGDVEDVAIRVICGLMASAWTALLLMRCCFWNLLFGAKPWRLHQTTYGVSILALCTDFIEIAAVLCVFGATVNISGYGVFSEAGENDFRRPANAALLFPIPLAIVLPLTSMTWQLVSADRSADRFLPSKPKLCCLRLRKRHWFRVFVALICCHGLPMLILTSYSLVRAPGGNDENSIEEPAIQACLADVDKECGEVARSARQLPDFSYDHRSFCLKNCEAEMLPLRGAQLRLEMFAFRMEVAVGAWVLLARLAQLWMAWQLDSARAQSQPSPREKKATEAAEATSAQEALDAASTGFGAMFSFTDEHERANPFDTSTSFGDTTVPLGSAAGRSSKDVFKSSHSNLSNLSTKDLQKSNSKDRTPRSARSSQGGAASARSNRSNTKDALAKDEDWADRILQAVSAIDRAPSTVSDGFPTAAHPLATVSTAAPTLSLTFPSSSKQETSAVAAGGSVAEVLAGQESKILDFAQQIARQCSRDTLASEVPNSSRSQGEDIFVPRKDAKASCEQESGRKQRFVATW